jgi:hypothetical protein
VIQLKCIGYWMESLRDDRLPLPQELVGEMPATVRNAVCKYLSEGYLFATYRGYSQCRFRCGASGEQMGYREYTDGEWVWPEGLLHYIRAHNVIVPEGFVASATSQRPKKEVSENAPTSLDFWIEWAAYRRSSKIRQQLAESLAAAEIAAKKLIQSKINSTTEREGISDQRCIFSGCSRSALLQRKVCARHFLGDDELEMVTSELYRLPEDF